MQQYKIWYFTRPRALRKLLAINVCIYLLWVVALAHIGGAHAFITEHLALRTAWPGLLYAPWQLVTYSFLHLGTGFGGLIHIGFNMLWLYWIGHDVEEQYGSHALVTLYLFAAAGGALLSALFYNLVGAEDVLVHGASGSVLGIITALAVWQPYYRIRLWLIGSHRLIYLVIGFLVLDILLSFGSGVAVSAHLGGALIGFLFVRLQQAGIDLSNWARGLFEPRPHAAPRARVRPRLLDRLEHMLDRRRADPPRGEEPAGMPVSEEELDRILDKINDTGLDSLSPKERAVLESFSRSR